MDTRIERRKKIKKQKRRMFFKSLVIILTLVLLYYGIKVVNKSIIYLDYFTNPTIFNLNIEERELELFGESYFIDLKIFKKNN